MNSGFNDYQDLINQTTTGEDLASIEAELTALEEEVADNKTNIATNTTNIATNTLSIATNSSNITTNSNLISANSVLIGNNINDIATNTSNISTNTSNISTNTLSISTNTLSISTLNNTVLLRDGSIDLDAGYNPGNAQSIATKNYVDTHSTSGNYLRVDGSNTMLANLPLDNHSLTQINQLDFNGGGSIFQSLNTFVFRTTQTLLNLENVMTRLYSSLELDITNPFIQFGADLNIGTTNTETKINNTGLNPIYIGGSPVHYDEVKITPGTNTEFKNDVKINGDLSFVNGHIDMNDNLIDSVSELIFNLGSSIREDTVNQPTTLLLGNTTTHDEITITPGVKTEFKNDVIIGNDLTVDNDLIFINASIREVNNTIDFRISAVPYFAIGTTEIDALTDFNMNNNQITNAGVISTHNLNATGDIYGTNLNATNDINILGDVKCVAIISTGNLSCVNISATGNLDMNNNQINNLANATLGSDAVNLSQVNTIAGNYVLKSGDTMTGDLDMNLNSILDAETIQCNNIVSQNGTDINVDCKEFHISSGTSGDCKLILEADTDNNNEQDTPQILFLADGSLTEGAIYLNNNTLDIVNSVSTNGGIRFLTTTTDSDYTNGNLALTISSTTQNVDVYETLNLRDYINNNSSSKLQLASSESTRHQTDTGCISYRSNNTFGHSLDIYGGRDTTQATTERKIVLHDDVNVEGYFTISGSAGDMDGTGHRGARQLLLNNTLNDAAGWAIGNQIDGQPTTSDNDLYFEVRYTNNTYNVAGFVQDSVSKGQMNFTGQHRCASNDLKINHQLIGLIVESSGEYRNMIDYNDQLICNKNSITISESLPLVNLCNEEKSKKVFGVLSDVEVDRRSFGNNFQSLYTLKQGDERYFINSIGEGAIWIHNNNGNIENGDYICSYLNGYGQKQDEVQLCNFTVAKATMNCDFNPQLEVVKLYDGIDEEGKIKFKDATDDEGNIIYEPEYECITLDDGSKIAFIGCTYHCG